MTIGSFATVKNGLPYVAHVDLTLMKSNITVVASFESLFGAVASFGVHCALSDCNQEARVFVSDIKGAYTDTTPGAVAAAAMRAVYQALGREPNQEKIEQIGTWTLS